MTVLIIIIAWLILCTIALIFNYGAHRKETPEQEEK